MTHGGGDPPPVYARTGEVDTVDGILLVLSPWAVRHVRFDESLGLVQGYVLDVCLQVREAGRKVVTPISPSSTTTRSSSSAIPSTGSRRTSGSPRSGTAGYGASAGRPATGRPAPVARRRRLRDP